MGQLKGAKAIGEHLGVAAVTVRKWAGRHDDFPVHLEDVDQTVTVTQSMLVGDQDELETWFYARRNKGATDDR